MKKVLLASTLLAGMASTATAGNVVDVLASPAVGMTMGVDKTAEVVNGAPGALKPVLALSVVPAVILFGIGNFLNELGNLGN